jgi:hypothetical protein
MNKRQKRSIRKPTSKRRSPLLARLPTRSQSARGRASLAVAAMKHNPRLRVAQASKRYRVKVATIKKYFGSELIKVNGQLQVKISGRYSLTVYLPDEHGNPVPLQTPSRKERKQASDYLRDVGRYLGGNRNALSKWRGKKIAEVELVTDGRTLVAMEPALSDFSLYRALNGGAV